MSTAGGRTLVHTGSHWGLYDAEVENGRVVGVRAFAKDPRPRRIIEAVPSAVHADCRIDRPVVRRGWLERGVKSHRAGRGVEPFVALSWDEALDLIAAELTRVKEVHGNEALTLDKGTSKLAQCCSAQTALVEVERFDGEAPPVTAFSTPAVTRR